MSEYFMKKKINNFDIIINYNKKTHINSIHLKKTIILFLL